MDDRWGDILYLVFLVLLLIVGALKKKKTQKSPAPPVQGAEEMESVDEKPSGFETVLETLLGDEVMKTLKEEEAQKMAASTPEIVEKEKIKEKVSKKNETFSPLKSVKNFSVFTQEDEMEDDQVEYTDYTDMDQTDWRNAIIYSEIINRKYN